MADETALATTPGRASPFLAGLLVSCFLAAFLAACAGLPTLIGIRPGSVDKGDRVVTIFNVHTKETVRATYWQDGKFRRTELDRVDAIFRDWRTGDEINVDPALVDLLWGLHTELGSKEPIHLISGHRSPRTNDMLLRTRGGQAKKSLHIEGMAADVFFPDVSVERLRNAALSRNRGGVGYYPGSSPPFVHLDTGRARSWVGEDKPFVVEKSIQE